MKKYLSVKKYELIYRGWLKKLFQKFGELTDLEIKKSIEQDKDLLPEIVQYFYDKINFKIIDDLFMGVLGKNSEYLNYILKKKDVSKLIMQTLPQSLTYQVANEKRMTFFEGEKDLIESELVKSFETRKNQLDTFRNSFLFNSPDKFETFKEKYPLPEYKFTNSMGRTEINNLNRDLGAAIATSMGAKKCEWLTSGDERVRESHQELNGLIFDYQELPVQYNDYNCRCTLLPVLDSIEGF